MNQIKPGCLAITTGCASPLNNNRIVVVGEFLGEVDGWVGDRRWSLNIATPIIGARKGLAYRHIQEQHLRPLPGGEGNEDFVVKARKTLPRAKPVTGPVTINSRGEVA